MIRHRLFYSFVGLDRGARKACLLRLRTANIFQTTASTNRTIARHKKFVDLLAVLSTMERAFLNRKIAGRPLRGQHIREPQEPCGPRIHVAHLEDVAMRSNLNFSLLFESTI